ncbi:hypothetical protein BGX28_008545 [Mortierella sp. GBA30]|nr:hypothetical protein BGX28_008545 [Mortierella sp. GBA30]
MFKCSTEIQLKIPHEAQLKCQLKVQLEYWFWLEPALLSVLPLARNPVQVLKWDQVPVADPVLVLFQVCPSLCLVQGMTEAMATITANT